MICGVDANVLIYSAVESMPEHTRVLSFFEERVLTGELACAITVPVLLEFIHITTDPRRFSSPLTVAESLDFAEKYWNAAGWHQLVPKAQTGSRTLALIREHRLCRKRLLDTHLVATLLDNNINALITCDPGDFAVFRQLQILNPLKIVDA